LFEKQLQIKIAIRQGFSRQGAEKGRFDMRSGLHSGIGRYKLQISRLQLFEMIDELFSDTVVTCNHEKLFMILFKSGTYLHE